MEPIYPMIFNMIYVCLCSNIKFYAKLKFQEICFEHIKFDGNLRLQQNGNDRRNL